MSHFAPSFCDILQQIKHPLLGMFSICFMLILIKESETEQTVPSRWPYKCEISKPFYLPQTLLVNFFKLIPASESLLVPRRKLSNPSLQIFALVTALVTTPGGAHLGPTLVHRMHPDPSLAQHKSQVPTPWGSMATTSTGGQVHRGEPPALSLPRTTTSQPPTPTANSPTEARPSSPKLTHPGEEHTQGPRTRLAFLP